MRICPECRQRTEERTCPSCRITTVDESAMSGQDLVGKVFVERYEVVEILGRGGMGAVYRARHLAMDSMVALKVLRREASGDLESIERFYREARSASRLQHPNTIRVFDFGQSEDGQLFLAMEFLDGRTLRSEVRRVGRMDEARVLRIAEQVARSLGEAHGKGIVHRDVKPENVFLTEMVGHPDFVKVLDFGVARTMSNESLTRTGLAIGTPAYMSPEQARGEKVDGRSDLYSLGVMMFEMAAGIPPFESNTPMHLMLKHISEPPPRLADLCGGGITPGFEDLVQMLLAKAAADRPRDAEDLLDRITALKPQVATPRQTQATMHLGTEAPTPIRNGRTAFLGSEPSPTPTTPMGSIPGDGGTGPGRASRTAAAAADTSLLHEGPRTAGAAGPIEEPGGPRPGTPAGSQAVATPPGMDLGSAPGGPRHPWIAPALIGATVALALAGAFAWWFVATNGNGDGGAAVVVTAGTPTAAPGTTAFAPGTPAPATPPPAAPAPSPAPSPASPTPAAEAPAGPSPAAAQAPPARAPAKARLSGSPDGARVSRLPDNTPLGRLPLDVEIPPDVTVRVRVTAPGYRAQDLDLAWSEVKAFPNKAVRLEKKAAAPSGDGWDL